VVFEKYDPTASAFFGSHDPVHAFVRDYPLTIAPSVCAPSASSAWRNSNEFREIDNV
jgi:hypothetical protein